MCTAKPLVHPNFETHLIAAVGVTAPKFSMLLCIQNYTNFKFGLRLWEDYVSRCILPKQPCMFCSKGLSHIRNQLKVSSRSWTGFSAPKWNRQNQNIIISNFCEIILKCVRSGSSSSLSLTLLLLRAKHIYLTKLHFKDVASNLGISIEGK
jgi:hypothetical protein